MYYKLFNYSHIIIVLEFITNNKRLYISRLSTTLAAIIKLINSNDGKP